MLKCTKYNLVLYQYINVVKTRLHLRFTKLVVYCGPIFFKNKLCLDVKKLHNFNKKYVNIILKFSKIC